VLLPLKMLFSVRFIVSILLLIKVCAGDQIASTNEAVNSEMLTSKILSRFNLKGVAAGADGDSRKLQVQVNNWLDQKACGANLNAIRARGFTEQKSGILANSCMQCTDSNNGAVGSCRLQATSNTYQFDTFNGANCLGARTTVIPLTFFDDDLCVNGVETDFEDDWDIDEDDGILTRYGQSNTCGSVVAWYFEGSHPNACVQPSGGGSEQRTCSQTVQYTTLDCSGPSTRQSMVGVHGTCLPSNGQTVNPFPLTNPQWASSITLGYNSYMSQCGIGGSDDDDDFGADRVGIVVGAAIFGVVALGGVAYKFLYPSQKAPTLNPAEGDSSL